MHQKLENSAWAPGADESSSGRLQSLESIRGIAALLVVLYHCPPWVPFLFENRFVRNGNLCVTIFFVVSGFVICRAYVDEIKSARDVWRFQLRRAGRLYPLHVTILGIFVTIDALRWFSGRPSLSVNDGLSTFFAHLLLLQGFSERATFAFNGPSWSIGVEFYTYLLFAAVALLVTRWRGLTFFLFALVAMGSLMFDLPQGLMASAHCVAGFFTGALVALFARHIPVRIAPWFAAAGAVGTIGLMATFDHAGWLRVAECLIGAALVGGLARGEAGPVARALKWRPFRIAGEWSYSIYMTHMLVLILMGFATMRLGYPLVSHAGYTLPAVPTSISVAFYLVTFGLTLAASWLGFNFIERPWRDRSRRWVAARFSRP